MTLSDLHAESPHVSSHNDERHAINSLDTRITKSKLYVPNRAYTGPATDQITSIQLGQAADPLYNEQYAPAGGQVPANWPVDVAGPATVVGTLWATKTSVPSVTTVSTYRTQTDAPQVALYTHAGGFWIDLYVDGKPYQSNPIVPVATAGAGSAGIQILNFADSRMRLLEFRMIGGLYGIFVKKPYRMYKPPKDINPTIAVVGDSYVLPYVMNDAAAGQPSSGLYLRGLYQRMPALLGLPNLVTDGIGGSGYIEGGTAGKPYGHADRLAWLNATQPDVIVVHGGGANDLNSGASVASVITAAVNYFTALREQHPNAKLVFVEGFAPPLFTPATFNLSYKQAREGVQTALIAADIYAYYIDVASTRPPIHGSGYVTAPNNTGNSDIYIGSDQTHYTALGAAFIRNWLAPKIARVLADPGDLVNTTI